MIGINDAASFQFVEKVRWITVEAVPWVGRIEIEYFLGIDGLSVIMILLTALIALIGVISSWSITKMVKGYFIAVPAAGCRYDGRVCIAGLLPVLHLLGVYAPADVFF